MGGTDELGPPVTATGVCQSWMRPLPLLPLSPTVCGLMQLWRCLRRHACCGFGCRVRPLDQSRSLWLVLGVSGCRAAALAVGDATFLGGACVSGAGAQPWPRGWLVELGCVGGV